MQIFIPGNVPQKSRRGFRAYSDGLTPDNYSDGVKRRCKVCGKVKSLKSFPNKINKPTGKRYYQYRCNSCQYQEWLIKNEKRRDIYVKNQRNREQSTIEGRALMLRNRCKARAKKYGYAFKLSKSLLVKKIKNGVCEQTGVKIYFGEEMYHSHAPSVDRIDNEKGYTDDNVQIVCMIYNFCKNKFTDNQVHNFIKEVNLCKSL